MSANPLAARGCARPQRAPSAPVHFEPEADAADGRAHKRQKRDARLPAATKGRQRATQPVGSMAQAAAIAATTASAAPAVPYAVFGLRDEFVRDIGGTGSHVMAATALSASLHATNSYLLAQLAAQACTAAAAAAATGGKSKRKRKADFSTRPPADSSVAVPAIILDRRALSVSVDHNETHDTSMAVETPLSVGASPACPPARGAPANDLTPKKPLHAHMLEHIISSMHAPACPAAAVAAAAAGDVAMDSACASSAASASAGPAPATTSAFLNFFTRYPDMWFSLLHSKLNLSDFALLHRTCRTTKQLIEQPTAMLRSSKRTRVVSPVPLRGMVACTWVKPFIMSLKVNMRPGASSASAAPPPLVSTFAEVAQNLRAFPRLSWLGLQLCSQDASRDEIRELFQHFGPRLQHLNLLMAGAVAPPAAAAAAQPRPLSVVASVFEELHLLPGLESLSVGNMDELPSSLTFRHLSALPKLKQLSITLSRGPATPTSSGNRSFFCTASQNLALAACKQLVHLRCGIWSTPWNVTDAKRSRAFVEAGIGQVVKGKLQALKAAEEEQQAARSAPGFSSATPLPPMSALPLQLLNLEGTVLSRDTFEFVSQLPSLLSLSPFAWRSDITPQQWASLSQFKNLRAFSLMTHPLDVYGENPIRADQVLPPLMHCTQLQTLHFQSFDISRAQMAGIAQRLPLLKHLSLRAQQIESLEPLRDAPRLQVLSLHFCTQPPQANGVSERNFRELVPPIPSLTGLLIHDRVRLPESAVAALNAGLVARLPSLRLQCFHQNLLPPVVIDPAFLPQTQAQPTQPEPQEHEAAASATGTASSSGAAAVPAA